MKFIVLESSQTESEKPLYGPEEMELFYRAWTKKMGTSGEEIFADIHVLSFLNIQYLCEQSPSGT